MINYANQEVKVDGCLGCAYANHQFSLPCGIAYENDRFTLSQDWELPIVGFMVISPKRCIHKFNELTSDERVEMFNIIDETIRVLKNNNVCDNFNVVFEEKYTHFHVWIMPRHEWMNKLTDNIIGNLDMIFDYAIETFKTEEVFNMIQKVNDVLRSELKRVLIN